jgi:hypothetical protein
MIQNDFLVKSNKQGRRGWVPAPGATEEWLKIEIYATYLRPGPPSRPPSPGNPLPVSTGYKRGNETAVGRNENKEKERKR